MNHPSSSPEKSVIYDAPNGLDVQTILDELHLLITEGFGHYNAIMFEHEYTHPHLSETLKWYPLTEMIQFGFLDYDTLREWMKEGLMEVAYNDLALASDFNTDFVVYREHFAYAIEHRLFTEREIESIVFLSDEIGGLYRGENYVKKYGNPRFIDDQIEEIASIENVRNIKTAMMARQEQLIALTEYNPGVPKAI